MAALCGQLQSAAMRDLTPADAGLSFLISSFASEPAPCRPC